MKYQGDSLRKFSSQILFALEQYKSPSLDINQFDNIILCGLGGSGIAARITKSYFAEISTKPIEVISDYFLPKYTSSKSLVILSSYSGNTEETLLMYNEAKSKGAGIVTITTGGQLGQLAKEDGFPIYAAETGFQPRMALGYSLSYLLLIFGEFFGIDTASQLKSAASELSDVDRYIDAAREIFNNQIKHDLKGKICVVADAFSNPVALRFCQQIQENAKAEAFLSELPEANHNVIESYYGQLPGHIIFLNSGIHLRTNLRFDFIENLLKEEGNHPIKMQIDHSNLTDYLEKIYILDWISLLIADAKGLDSSNIRNINSLKNYLSTN